MMKKFSLYGTCPKCGYDGTPNGALSGKWQGHIMTIHIPASMLGPRAECLLRRCPRCSFEWNEACLDAEFDNTLEGS